MEYRFDDEVKTKTLLALKDNDLDVVIEVREKPNEISVCLKPTSELGRGVCLEYQRQYHAARGSVVHYYDFSIEFQVRGLSRKDRAKKITDGMEIELINNSVKHALKVVSNTSSINSKKYEENITAAQPSANTAALHSSEWAKIRANILLLFNGGTNYLVVEGKLIYTFRDDDLRVMCVAELLYHFTGALGIDPKTLGKFGTLSLKKIESIGLKKGGAEEYEYTSIGVTSYRSEESLIKGLLSKAESDRDIAGLMIAEACWDPFV